jgi:hypothetical protein
MGSIFHDFKTINLAVPGTPVLQPWTRGPKKLHQAAWTFAVNFFAKNHFFYKTFPENALPKQSDQAISERRNS